MAKSAEVPDEASPGCDTAAKKNQPGKTQRLHRETGEDFESNIPPDNALGVVLFKKLRTDTEKLMISTPALTAEKQNYYCQNYRKVKSPDIKPSQVKRQLYSR